MTDEKIASIGSRPPAARAPVAAWLRTGMDRLTARERKVAHLLLSNYPMAGLETVAEFARRSAVSAPTVLRFVNKLGFAGYPEFQRQIRAELDERLQSPLGKAAHPGQTAAEHQTSGGPQSETEKQSLLQRFGHAAQANISETLATMPIVEFNAVARLFAATDKTISIAGGRFTDPIARYITVHLKVVRPNVVHLAGQIDNWRDHLLDMGRRDVLVVADIRRYQDDVVDFARAARAQDVTVVLLTDQWLSPAARHAHHIIAARTPVPSNWDSCAALMVVAEALIASATERCWTIARGRIERLETMRDGDKGG
ncbi:Transcriptional regulator, RpiR family [hydrothermal vent metagenome]|uniref:Transcriptional regulator, RpiR family n=1 Tax=hydrothermal vent metagenome TaxID=652676 RepID=A0A3B0SW25_9ZZZZ